VLIDADHYLWFCLRHRRVNPVAAVRFFHQADAPQHSATRVLHSPRALLAALVLAVARPRWLPVAAGMALHVALDARHEARLNQARVTALKRDGFSCRSCGASGAGVGTHLERQPTLLPSYGPENLVSLCGPCHQRAHARARGSGPWS
jgi:5-methylcytosine-specific restriction endonuclease McrA